MVHDSAGGGFQGCYLDNHRNNWRCARAVRKRPHGEGGGASGPLTPILCLRFVLIASCAPVQAPRLPPERLWGGGGGGGGVGPVGGGPDGLRALMCSTTHTHARITLPCHHLAFA